MLIWSGKGIIVPLFVVVAFFLCAFATTPLHLQESVSMAVGFGMTGVLAGAGLFFTARAIESKEGRVFIDAATNQQFTVRPSAGSFFFIPTRYWAYIVALAGLAFAIMAFVDPSLAAGS